MELQQFITTTIKAIGKGIKEGGEEENISSGNPWVGKSDNKGVEFDILIVTNDKGEIHIKDYPAKDVALASRIKFAIPISVK